MHSAVSLNRNNGLLDAPHYETFKKKVSDTYSSKAGRILFGRGNPQANVAIVGYRPDGDEKEVFSGNHSSAVQGILDHLGVPAFAVWLTYVIKQPPDKEVLQWKDVKPWSALLFEELSIVKSRATILVGVETAWAILGTDQPNVEELRLKRFLKRHAEQTNMFVTYSSENFCRYGGINGRVGRTMTADMDAVFNVINGYFPKSVVI